MAKSLLKKEYPKISKEDEKKIHKVIDGKCSEYYFIDFLRTTSGNVDDAIGFFYLDEKLRSLLSQYLIRFEIQIKSDFAIMVEKGTCSKQFWRIAKYYSHRARIKNNGISFYEKTKRNIQKSIDRMKFDTIGPLNYVAMYAISLGEFKILFRYIDLIYKQNFINLYTSHLRCHKFDVLYSYLNAIRLLRNRCAHGNHIITLKFKNELNGKAKSVLSHDSNPLFGIYITAFEAVLIFLYMQLNCGYELKKKLKILLNSHNFNELLIKYKGKHSLSCNIIEKLLSK